jgi:proteic killer suppression protein
VIVSFRDADAERLFHDEFSKKYQAIEKTARRKLLQVDQAQCIDDLYAVPGNRLEVLRGDRAGQHSLRVNNQFRICFDWSGSDASNVEIVDYH